jgi:hypothetical protein
LKKYYFLALCILLVPLVYKAQHLQVLDQDYLKLLQENSSQASQTPAIKKSKLQKAYGDTIFYEDFDSLSVATNWTIVDNSGMNMPWLWAPPATIPGGMGGVIPTLNSTTTGNGFMILPSAQYNSPTLRGPMQTYFSSSAITITPAVSKVIVQFEQYLRFCCSSQTELVLEVSTDGFSWTSFDANLGRGTSFSGINGERIEIDVSSVLANQTTAYFRFRSSLNTHYFWMLDDFLVFEGPNNNVKLLRTAINFHPGYDLVPQYYEVPLSNLSSIGFSGLVNNGGGNIATNVSFYVDIIQDSLIGGGSGSGSVYKDTVQVGSGTLQPSASDTAFLPNLFRNSPAHYSINYSVTSDSINDQPFEAVASRPVKLTFDTIVSLERGEAYFEGSIGPGAYLQSSGIGDALAALVIIDNPKVIGGISFWVDSANAANLAGLALSPRVWSFDETKVIQNGQIIAPLDSGITALVGNSPFSKIIDTCTVSCPPSQSSMINTWVDFSFLAPVSLNAGTYFFGIEQTAGLGRIMGSRDPVAEEQATLWSNIMYLGGVNSWGWGNFVVGLRLFYDQIRPGLNEGNLNSSFSVQLFPNPSDGLFTLEIANSGATTYMINVRNRLGQTVMSEAINVNRSAVKQLDLSTFDKGVYFVSLENGEDKLVKKLLVK